MSFTNAKIVRCEANPSDYFLQTEERGTAGFVMSSHALREFAQCPSRWKAGYSSPDSDAKANGRLLDCLLLTPEAFDKRYAVQPETYRADTGKEEKDWNNNATVCREWNAEQKLNGFEIVKQWEVEEAEVAIHRLLKDDIILAFLSSGKKQVWIKGDWMDEATGLIIPCQCLVDIAPDKSSEFADCLGDLKTTKNAALMPWQRWCYQAGYHIQGALYLDLWNAMSGEQRTTWCFVLQENYPPWEPAKRILSQDFLALGRASYRNMLANYAQCLKSNRWPGYDDHDESVQSWSVVQAEPFMAEREVFAPHYQFALEPEADALDDVPIT